MHLYDSTPYHILNGHVALKAPCGDDRTTPLQILIGSAPNMTVVNLKIYLDYQLQENNVYTMLI